MKVSLVVIEEGQSDEKQKSQREQCNSIQSAKDTAVPSESKARRSSGW